MNYHHFQDNEIQQLFELNNLSEFEQLWTLDDEWFEKPNIRRNGWSGVIRYPLSDDQGKTIEVFIKRQENHNHKTLLHPIKGLPTFRREFLNIHRLHKKKIPTLTVLYYGERQKKGKTQSILITLALEGYQSFADFFLPENELLHDMVSNVMQLAGQNTRLLHDAYFRHGSLYPKHLFVKADNKGIDVRFIDLENLKWYPLINQIRYSDLSRIIRHRGPIKKQQLEIFIDSYLKYGRDLRHSVIAHRLNKLLNNV